MSRPRKIERSWKAARLAGFLTSTSSRTGYLTPVEGAVAAAGITGPAEPSTRAFVRGWKFDFRPFQNGPKFGSINAFKRTVHGLYGSDTRSANSIPYRLSYQEVRNSKMLCSYVDQFVRIFRPTVPAKANDGHATRMTVI